MRTLLIHIGTSKHLLSIEALWVDASYSLKRHCSLGMSKNATSGGRVIKRGAWQIRILIRDFVKATVVSNKETDESLDNYAGIQSNSHKGLGQPTTA